MRFASYFLVLLFAMAGCKASKSTATVSGSIPTTSASPEAAMPDQILFVTLASTDSTASSSKAFAIVKSYKSNGKLKRGTGYIPNSDFIAYFISSTGSIIDSATFNDPLKQKTEYADEQGKITVLQGHKPVAAPLRVNYQSAMSGIRIVSRQTKKTINELNIQ